MNIGIQTFTIRKSQKRNIEKSYLPLIEMGIVNFEVARIKFNKKNALIIKSLIEKDNKKLHTNLILTNKRIINASESNLTIKRQEHAIEDVVGIEGAFMKNARGGPMFLKVISIIWTCTIIGALLGGIAGIMVANLKAPR